MNFRLMLVDVTKKLAAGWNRENRCFQTCGDQRRCCCCHDSFCVRLDSRLSLPTSSSFFKSVKATPFFVVVVVPDAKECNDGQSSSSARRKPNPSSAEDHRTQERASDRTKSFLFTAQYFQQNTVHTLEQETARSSSNPRNRRKPDRQKDDDEFLGGWVFSSFTELGFGDDDDDDDK